MTIFSYHLQLLEKLIIAFAVPNAKTMYNIALLVFNFFGTSILILHMRIILFKRFHITASVSKKHCIDSC